MSGTNPDLSCPPKDVDEPGVTDRQGRRRPVDPVTHSGRRRPVVSDRLLSLEYEGRYPETETLGVPNRTRRNVPGEGRRSTKLRGAVSWLSTGPPGASVVTREAGEKRGTGHRRVTTWAEVPVGSVAGALGARGGRTWGPGRGKQSRLRSEEHQPPGSLRPGPASNTSR